MAAVTRLKPGSRVSPSGRVLLLLADVEIHLQTVNCTETVIRNCESLSRLGFFSGRGETPGTFEEVSYMGQCFHRGCV